MRFRTGQLKAARHRRFDDLTGEQASMLVRATVMSKKSRESFLVQDREGTWVTVRKKGKAEDCMHRLENEPK